MGDSELERLQRENEALSVEVDHLRMGLRLCKQAVAAKMTLEEWIEEFNRLEPRQSVERNDEVVYAGIQALEQENL
jgi:cell division protein FtsB